MNLRNDGWLCHGSAMEPLEIITLRKGLGLTQEELANRIGVTVGTVSLWETGKRRPRKIALKALSKIRDEAVAA
jgi:type I restriction enzyme M protein